MLKFISGMWRVIRFPFLLIFNILAFPFRTYSRFNRFLNTEPEERPLSDVFVDLATNEKVRTMMWEQIEVLRAHLLRAVLGLAVGVGISFYFTQRIVQFLAQPIGGLSALKAIEVTESIGVYMRVALLCGIALAFPYIVFELWWFAAPGLKPRERKIGLVGIPLATLFFLAGMGFAYFIMLPTALPFLLNFLGIQSQLRPQSYFSFVTGLMLWIGIAFEFPLVIYVLTAIGFIKPQSLAHQWRLAIVIIAIVSAAITPTVDPVNMALVMLPMTLLYFVSIVLSYIAYAGRKKTG
jgi:sec-independent protein translocase protein TatC